MFPSPLADVIRNLYIAVKWTGQGQTVSKFLGSFIALTCTHTRLHTHKTKELGKHSLHITQCFINSSIWPTQQCSDKDTVDTFTQHLNHLWALKVWSKWVLAVSHAVFALGHFLLTTSHDLDMCLDNFIFHIKAQDQPLCPRRLNNYDKLLGHPHLLAA